MDLTSFDVQATVIRANTSFLKKLQLWSKHHFQPRTIFLIGLSCSILNNKIQPSQCSSRVTSNCRAPYASYIIPALRCINLILMQILLWREMKPFIFRLGSQFELYKQDVLSGLCVSRPPGSWLNFVKSSESFIDRSS